MANVQEEESIFCSRRTDKSTDILGPCGNDDVAIRTRESTNVRASVHPSGRLSEGCSEIVFPI